MRFIHTDIRTFSIGGVLTRWPPYNIIIIIIRRYSTAAAATTPAVVAIRHADDEPPYIYITYTVCRLVIINILKKKNVFSFFLPPPSPRCTVHTSGVYTYTCAAAGLGIRFAYNIIYYASHNRVMGGTSVRKSGPAVCRRTSLQREDA